MEKWKFNPQPSAFESKSISTLPDHDGINQSVVTFDTDIENNHHEFGISSLDIIVNLSDYSIPKDIYTIPKYGIWQYCHTDEKKVRGGPPAFWELFEDHSIMGCSVKIFLQDMAPSITATKSFTSVEPISVNRNLNLNYWKSVSLLPREIKKLCKQGPDQYFQNLLTQNNQIEFYTSTPYSVPQNGRFVTAFVKRLWKYFKFKYIQLVKNEQWVLMYDIGNAPSQNINTYRYIIPPKDRFWADPFVVYRNDKYYVFFEEALNSNPEHAYICYLIINNDGNVVKPKKILHQNYHLSFPFVIQYDSKYWMIPETADNHTIEIYRCLDFPERWELHKVLIPDIVAYDTTIFFHNNRWWLFTTVVENTGSSSWDELFLFYADSPIADNWIAHPQNPIISDVRNARPAGNIFTHNNQIYRPVRTVQNAMVMG